MKKLLIIEDDPQWAAVLERYVLEAGYTARTVVAAGQAIAMIDEWRPDGLVLDMLLAGETGMVLLNELQSHEDLSLLPVVVCSNVVLDLDQLRSFGVRAVLDKARMTPDDVRVALSVLGEEAE